jgi:hypothetical protein
MHLSYENKKQAEMRLIWLRAVMELAWMNRRDLPKVSAFHFFYCRDSLCAGAA